MELEGTKYNLGPRGKRSHRNGFAIVGYRIYNRVVSVMVLGVWLSTSSKVLKYVRHFSATQWRSVFIKGGGITRENSFIFGCLGLKKSIAVPHGMRISTAISMPYLSEPTAQN